MAHVLIDGYLSSQQATQARTHSLLSLFVGFCCFGFLFEFVCAFFFVLIFFVRYLLFF